MRITFICYSFCSAVFFFFFWCPLLRPKRTKTSKGTVVRKTALLSSATSPITTVGTLYHYFPLYFLDVGWVNTVARESQH